MNYSRNVPLNRRIRSEGKSIFWTSAFVVLGLAALHYSLVFLEFSADLNKSSPLEFNSAAWKANKHSDLRFRMTLHQDFKKTLLNRTESEVKQLLGEPAEPIHTFYYDNTLYFRINYGLCPAQDTDLVVSFCKGKVDHVSTTYPCEYGFHLGDQLSPISIPDTSEISFHRWDDIEVIKRLLHI